MRQIKKELVEFKNKFLYIDSNFICNNEGYESISDIREEIANLYLIAEMGFGNHACLILVAAFDEGEAIHKAKIDVLENVASIEIIEIID
jgi:hypothetical protein